MEKKDLDLAAAQKSAEEKTALADQKLASVGKLEEENVQLKTTLNEANKDVIRLKKGKEALSEKVDDLNRKRDELEAYLGDLPRSYSSCLKNSAKILRKKLGGSRPAWTPSFLPLKMKLP